MIAIDSSKQQALDADTKVVQQTNFTTSLEPDRDTAMFFIIEEAIKTILDFPQGTVEVFLFTLIWYQYKMTQYDTLNVNLFDLQLNKLKSAWDIKSKKHKMVCTPLNYIEHFLILASATTGCISISFFLFCFLKSISQ